MALMMWVKAVVAYHAAYATYAERVENIRSMSRSLEIVKEALGASKDRHSAALSRHEAAVAAYSEACMLREESEQRSAELQVGGRRSVRVRAEFDIKSATLGLCSQGV
jgi:hypothetical protein